MIATETIVPSTKLKIKFSTKRIEVDSGPKHEFGQEMSNIDGNRHFNSNEKSSAKNSNKRGPPPSTEGQKVKRQRIDRKGSMQCAIIVKSLISHSYGWVFSKPVDPVALNIPDYFTIISHPMDLGTIKSKLEKHLYSDIEEFAADMRLTFSNAMTYNPPGNDVYLMANELNNIFDRKWNDFIKKWKCEDEHDKSLTEATKETRRKSLDGNHLQHKEFLTRKVSEHKRVHKIKSYATKDARVEAAKLSQIPCKLTKKDLHKGSKGNNDGEQPPGSRKACSSLHLVKCKCSICGNTTCHCVIPNNSTRVQSDISSEGSEGRDLIASGADSLRKDYMDKCSSPMEKKSDLDSDGTASSLDSEHVCPSSQGVTTTDASSGEVWSTPILPEQLSPKKALRAAMLKRRFADTILKAQQKTLLEQGDKFNHQKLQLEKERLERIQCEERARIEAQIKAAEAAAKMKADEELRQRIEKEREAARAAIAKMKRTVDIEHNMEIIKELESLSGCTLSYKSVGGRNCYKVALETLDKPKFENPLEQLGLFIKEEYTKDEDEELLLNGGWEEGEIFN